MHVGQRLFSHLPDWHVALPALAIALVIAWSLTQFAVAAVRRWLVPHPDTAHPPAAVRATLRILRVVLLVVLTLLFVPPVLDMFGEPLRAGLRLSTLTTWLFDNGLRALLIIVLAFVAIRLAGVATARLERNLAQGSEPTTYEHAKRSRTLGVLIHNVVRALVVATAALMLLSELGVNTTPLLTSAGILGLAVGFGAQTLVKDVISGFFIILENQVRVGDVAEINGTGGLVEAITLRTIVLRDLRGAVHIFPCGSIATLANLTKDHAFAVLDIQVNYQHDTDEVVDVLRAAGATVQHTEALASSILGAIEVLGIENLGESSVTIRVRMKTAPQRQWDVARELRRQIKKAFDAHGIDIPVTQTITAITKAGS